MAKIKVCAYCRVSTKDKEQLTSFENQIAYFEREFGENADYDLVQLYADRGRSGTSLKRPDFDRMIADAGVDKSQIDGDLFRIVGKPKFNLILAKNTSRFARNVSADMLLKTLAKNGVYVKFMDTSLSTENAADIMTIQLLQVLDENESRDKSRKVLFGIQEGIKRGNIHAHGNLYGYKYYPKPENRLEVIEEEAEVVRLIFDLYANKGMGANRIRQYLTERGILTRNGKPFSERGLLIMIKNETYTGRGVRKKFTTGLIFEKHPVRETGEAVIFDTDKVPAIVDMATFEKAQRTLESKVQHTSQKGIYTGKTDFAGKVVCGCCGANYFVSGSDYIKSAGGRVRFYACKTKRTMSRDTEGKRVMLCNNPNISEKKLQATVTGITYTGLLRTRVFKGLRELERIRAVLASRIDRPSENEVKCVQEQLAEVGRQKEKLLDLYQRDLFTVEQLEERVQPLKLQEVALTEKIKALSKSNDEIYQDIAEVEETIGYLKEQDAILHDRLWKRERSKLPSRQEVLEDLEKIVVEADGELTLKFKAYEEIERLLQKHRYLMEGHAEKEAS